MIEIKRKREGLNEGVEKPQGVMGQFFKSLMRGEEKNIEQKITKIQEKIEGGLVQGVTINDIFLKSAKKYISIQLTKNKFNNSTELMMTNLIDKINKIEFQQEINSIKKFLNSSEINTTQMDLAQKAVNKLKEVCENNNSEYNDLLGLEKKLKEKKMICKVVGFKNNVIEGVDDIGNKIDHILSSDAAQNVVSGGRDLARVVTKTTVDISKNITSKVIETGVKTVSKKTKKRTVKTVKTMKEKVGKVVEKTKGLF